MNIEITSHVAYVVKDDNGCGDVYDRGIFLDKAKGEAYCKMMNQLEYPYSSFWLSEEKILDGVRTDYNVVDYYSYYIELEAPITSIDELLSFLPWETANYLSNQGLLDWEIGTTRDEIIERINTALATMTEKQVQDLIIELNHPDYRYENDPDDIERAFYTTDLKIEETDDYIEVFSSVSYEIAREEALKRYEDWKNKYYPI